MDGDSANFKPKDGPITRAHRLYRVPTAPNNNRTLELYHSREPALAGVAWPGAAPVFCRLDNDDPSDHRARLANSVIDVRHADVGEPLPFAEESFDLVILDRTLDDLAISARQHRRVFDAHRFLEHVAHVLVPGGLLAGCVDNRTGLKSVTRWARHILSGGRALAPFGQFTLHDLNGILASADFAEVRLFTLLINCDDPLRMVDIDPRVSKIAFRHELQVARDSYSKAGYLARRLAVELGFYPRMEESFFYLAYKQC